MTIVVIVQSQIFCVTTVPTRRCNECVYVCFQIPLVCVSGAGTLFWLLQDDPYPDFDGNAVYFPAHSSTRVGSDTDLVYTSPLFVISFFFSLFPKLVLWVNAMD